MVAVLKHAVTVAAAVAFTAVLSITVISSQLAASLSSDDIMRLSVPLAVIAALLPSNQRLTVLQQLKLAVLHC